MGNNSVCIELGPFLRGEGLRTGRQSVKVDLNWRVGWQERQMYENRREWEVATMWQWGQGRQRVGGQTVAWLCQITQE